MISKPKRKADTLSSMKGWIFLVVLALGLGVRLPVLLADTETILSHWASDDLFYFTQIASHLAAGEGLTFDGIHPTTGIQPLWLLLLVPFGRWFAGNGPLALSVAHWMVTGLTLITALLFPWLSRRFIHDDGEAGWLAAFIWVAHPRILGMTFEGTEGALSALAWVVALGVWKTDGKRTRSALLFGAVLGLGCLVRVDFLVPAVFLLVFRPDGISIRTGRRMVVSAVTMLLLAGTWPAVCWWVTGNPLPDSGVAKQLHAERLTDIQNSDSTFYPDWGLLSTALQGPRYLMTTGGRVSRLSMLLIPLSVMVFVFIGRSRERRWSIFPRTMLLAQSLRPAIAAAVCLMVLYPLVLRAMRFWYVTGPLLLMTLLTASFVLDLGSRVSERRVFPVLIAAVFWLGACNLEAALFPRRCHLSAFRSAAEIINKYALPPTRIGAFNSGVLSAWGTARSQAMNG